MVNITLKLIIYAVIIKYILCYVLSLTRKLYVATLYFNRILNVQIKVRS